MEENTKMTPLDLSSLLDGLDGKWVILSEEYDKVLRVGKSLEDILQYVAEGIVMRVERTDQVYSPHLNENTLYQAKE